MAFCGSRDVRPSSLESDLIGNEKAWCWKKEWIVKLAGTYDSARSCVLVCKGLSDEFEVKFSVHQGSVVSPLLFIIVLDSLSREIRRFQPTWNRASLSAFTRKRLMLWTEASIED